MPARCWPGAVFRQVEGWDPGYLGAIYRPMYFNGGIAVHGTNSDVLAQPKSHGCVGLTLPMMDGIRRSGQIKVGTGVLVY
ncbi:L,D-transpeptidase [Aestuariimicrobium ganziense]|uniref:L,D-transpeptidase n=1 Tax=Aestuariimicrobium ganziense TaxID=2773677 RepID=UPI001945A0E7|nr:L,D-transpeptidase [Aestuariimicrobium ganziense]